MTLVLVVGLAGFLAVRFADALRLPFLFDDYAILDKVRHRSLLALWAPRELLYGWYRPWSRETHFAVLDRLFGANPAAFRIASLMLWVVCIALFVRLVKRACGPRTATIASCGLAALGAWSGTLLWAAGAQELWMLVFALLAIHAFVRRRSVVAVVALVGALLSKETAGVVPGLAVIAAWGLQQEKLRDAVRRAAPLVAVTLLWAALHPTLRLRLLTPVGPAVDAAASTPARVVALRTLLSFANLERVPRPEAGWAEALVRGLPALLVLGAILAWNARPTTAPAATRAPTRRIVVAGLGWGLLAAAPLAAPGVVWAPYYALLAACGVWLTVGAALAGTPRAAAIVVLAVAALQPVQARTPAWEWGAHSFQQRAAFFTSWLERSLRSQHPTLPPHTRLFFCDVPQGIGLGHAWFTPVFRLWYRDTTLSAEFLSGYRMRRPDEPRGQDLFFRFEPPAQWVEIRTGPENAARAEVENPDWVDDHRRLAVQLGLAGDWRRAATELEKLATVHPEAAEFASNLAYALEQSGDPVAARRWETRADSLARLPRRGR